MSDQVDELLREIETLRDALQGRTVSCAWCNAQAKKQEELIEAVQTFVRAESMFAAKALVCTTTTYGDERPRLWKAALRSMCRLANVKP
jgi:hypothetical protein